MFQGTGIYSGNWEGGGGGFQLVHRKNRKIVLPSSNPVGEIGSGYPTNIYDGNSLSLPILRQKMAKSCGMMFIDLPDGGCYRDQNTWNKFLASEQKIILND